MQLVLSVAAIDNGILPSLLAFGEQKPPDRLVEQQQSSGCSYAGKRPFGCRGAGRTPLKVGKTPLSSTN